MDKLDLLILNELTEDAQKPFSKIAKKLCISTDTVIKRYDKITKLNLAHPGILFDPSKLGFKSMVFLFIKIKGNRDREGIATALAKLKRITTITSITGDFNIFADAQIKNLEEFTELIKQVSALSEVADVEFILSEDFSLYKTEFFSNMVRQALKNFEK
jgi:Lrp/AsnC family transcriptional regulator, regulator for asnA, asnC and gidA